MRAGIGGSSNQLYLGYLLFSSYYFGVGVGFGYHAVRDFRTKGPLKANAKANANVLQLEDHLFNGENQDAFGTGGLELAYYFPKTFLIKHCVN